MRSHIPLAMRVPPSLDANFSPKAIQPRHALLINPFYPKDPACEFRETCPNPDAGPDQYRSQHTGSLDR